MNELKDLLPKEPTFKINGKDYAIKLLTLDDIAYYEDNYGSLAEMLAIFSSEGKYKEKYEIIYAQLKDKSDFIEKEIEEINRVGKKEKRILTGPEVFYRSLNLSDITNPVNAFIEAINLSTPKLNKDQQEIVKKKQIQMTKKLGAKK